MSDTRIESQLADREALRRVPGLSTELEDITEVEYRKLQLERVVLVGVWAGAASGSTSAAACGGQPRLLIASRPRRWPGSVPACRAVPGLPRSTGAPCRWRGWRTG